MNACRAHREDLSALLDGTLAPAGRDRLQAHLEQCPACREALEELRLTLERIRALEPVEPPPWLAERILERVRAEPRPARRGAWFRGPRLPLPAAAILLLCLAGYLVTRVSGPGNLPVAPALPAAAESAAVPAGPAPAPRAAARTARPPAPAVPPESAVPAEPQAPPAPAGQTGQNRAELVGQDRAEQVGQDGAGQVGRDRAGLDQAKRQAGALATRAEAPAAKAAAPTLVFRLTALDPRGAGPRVESAVRGAGGTLLAAPAPGRAALTARVPAAALPALLERLEALGKVEGDRPDPAALGSEVVVRIAW